MDLDACYFPETAVRLDVSSLCLGSPRVHKESEGAGSSCSSFSTSTAPSSMMEEDRDITKLGSPLHLLLPASSRLDMSPGGSPSAGWVEAVGQQTAKDTLSVPCGLPHDVTPTSTPVKLGKADKGHRRSSTVIEVPPAPQQRTVNRPRSHSAAAAARVLTYSPSGTFGEANLCAEDVEMLSSPPLRPPTPELTRKSPSFEDDEEMTALIRSQRRSAQLVQLRALVHRLEGEEAAEHEVRRRRKRRL